MRPTRSTRNTKERPTHDNISRTSGRPQRTQSAINTERNSPPKTLKSRGRGKKRSGCSPNDSSPTITPLSMRESDIGTDENAFGCSEQLEMSEFIHKDLDQSLDQSDLDNDLEEQSELVDFDDDDDDEGRDDNLDEDETKDNDLVSAEDLQEDEEDAEEQEDIDDDEEPDFVKLHSLRRPMTKRQKALHGEEVEELLSIPLYGKKEENPEKALIHRKLKNQRRMQLKLQQIEESKTSTIEKLLNKSTRSRKDEKASKMKEAVTVPHLRYRCDANGSTISFTEGLGFDDFLS